MGGGARSRASRRRQTPPLGPSRSHSLRTRSLGQEAKTRLLRSAGGGGRQETLRKAKVRVHGGLRTHILVALGKEEFCWLRTLSVFV